MIWNICTIVSAKKPCIFCCWMIDRTGKNKCSSTALIGLILSKYSTVYVTIKGKEQYGSIFQCDRQQLAGI
jgi:hypothetical protein